MFSFLDSILSDQKDSKGEKGVPIFRCFFIVTLVWYRNLVISFFAKAGFSQQFYFFKEQNWRDLLAIISLSITACIIYVCLSGGLKTLSAHVEKKLVKMKEEVEEGKLRIIQTQIGEYKGLLAAEAKKLTEAKVSFESSMDDYAYHLLERRKQAQAQEEAILARHAENELFLHNYHAYAVNGQKVKSRITLGPNPVDEKFNQWKSKYESNGCTIIYKYNGVKNPDTRWLDPSLLICANGEIIIKPKPS